MHRPAFRHRLIRSPRSLETSGARGPASDCATPWPLRPPRSFTQRPSAPIVHGGRALRCHYEVVVALHPADGKVVTIDPATGWVARRWADFDAEWLPGGRPSLVVLGPAPPAAARHHVDAAGLAPL